MNYLVLDTETTNLEKCYCYNLGYTIISPEGETLASRDFVITQIWDNLPLFASAYYADKRPIYVKAMRAHKAEKIKWGYAMQEMKRDIKKFNVSSCYAYNSPFDDKVIQFNCDWFHTQNAIETIPIFDIRGYAHHFICNDEYFAFSTMEKKGCRCRGSGVYGRSWFHGDRPAARVSVRGRICARLCGAGWPQLVAG